MAHEQVFCTGNSTHSADHVWSRARSFLWDWHPAITSIHAQRSQSGALIRAFTVQGDETLYREQLSYFSDSKRALAYTHLSGIKDVHSYTARLTVTPTATGCTMTMTAQISAAAARAKEIATGTEAIFQSALAALADVSAMPRPRRDASQPNTQIDDLMLDDLPRLALSVTPPQDGPVCLFLHGIGGGRSNWQGQLPTAGVHMRAASLDLRGYGDSTLGPTPSTIDAYCTDILRVMEGLGTQKLVLCGLSYGAWIATSFAMRHPDKLAGLVLSGGCTGMSEAGPEEREAFRLSRETPLNAGQTPADFAPAVVDMLCAAKASQSARDALLNSMSAIPAATYRDALECFTNPLEIFNFAKLTLPVMMVTGEHDRLAPPSEISTVAGRIFDAVPCPDIRYEMIAGAGHVCNVEDPDAYNALLSEFLGRIPK